VSNCQLGCLHEAALHPLFQEAIHSREQIVQEIDEDEG
jgi:hypothetical protein